MLHVPGNVFYSVVFNLTRHWALIVGLCGCWFRCRLEASLGVGLGVGLDGVFCGVFGIDAGVCVEYSLGVVSGVGLGVV